MLMIIQICYGVYETHHSRKRFWTMKPGSSPFLFQIMHTAMVDVAMLADLERVVSLVTGVLGWAAAPVGLSPPLP